MIEQAEHRVRIYCDASSHAPKVATVGALIFDDEGGWRSLEATPLYDDRPPEHRLDSTTRMKDEDVRVRLRFECKLCGRLVVTRGERVYPKADALRAEGVRELSLSGLAAILTMR